MEFHFTPLTWLCQWAFLYLRVVFCHFYLSSHLTAARSCAKMTMLEVKSRNRHSITVWTFILHHKFTFVNEYFLNFRGLRPHFFVSFCTLHKTRAVESNSPGFIFVHYFFFPKKTAAHRQPAARRADDTIPSPVFTRWLTVPTAKQQAASANTPQINLFFFICTAPYHSEL